MTKAEIRFKNNAIFALKNALFDMERAEDPQRMLEIIFTLCEKLSIEM